MDISHFNSSLGWNLIHYTVSNSWTNTTVLSLDLQSKQNYYYYFISIFFYCLLFLNHYLKQLKKSDINGNWSLHFRLCVWIWMWFLNTEALLSTQRMALIITGKWNHHVTQNNITDTATHMNTVYYMVKAVPCSNHLCDVNWDESNSNKLDFPRMMVWWKMCVFLIYRQCC